jgi:Spy/CpxP family protein refolding chaperone
MKNHFKLFLSLAALALAATPALRADDTTAPTPPPPSDQPGGRHGRPEMRERFQKMVKDLNLTADQQSKGEAILQQGAQSLRALHDDTTLSDDDKRAKMKQIRQGIEQQIRALLTPEQQAKAKELRQQRRQGGGDQPPPPPPADKPTT